VKFPKPFFRRSKRAWYLQLGKRQIALGKDREQAFKKYQQLMLHERGRLSAPDSPLTVAAVADLFLDWCQRHNEPRTYEWYKDFLQDFCDRYGSVQALEVKPYHVTRWLDSHAGWGDSTRRCAITAVKRIFNWADAEALLAGNPLRQVRKPPVQRRDRIMSEAERQEIFGAIKDEEFRDFVFALEQTGCRPSEVSRVAAENVDLQHGLWVFTDHTTRKKTGRDRVVYLTPAMVDLTRKLLSKHPCGPLFLAPRSGRAFTRNGIRCRFRQLRKKLPHLKGVISYTYRHSYVTDALENGVGVAQVAELLGHVGTEMVMRHYQHLGEKREHLRQAGVQATRLPGS
jgi:integrase